FLIELKLKSVDPAQRAEFKQILRQHLDDYGRKLGIIRDSIYGIDIQPLAVQITKLRFFISLLIDQQTEKGITPMPNIETKIICAGSLKNIQPDLWSTDAIEKLYDARIKFYQPEISVAEREKISDEIVHELDRAFPAFSKLVTGKVIPDQNKALLKEWFNHATLAAPFYNQDFFFPELKDSGFDCVIGNPPYGGTKITDDVRKDLNIESKDPYGAFIARFLPSGERMSPLKHGGVLALIVSDTFMTIKSHLKLRRQMMDNYIHKMIRLHPDTFGATVNTAIIICERNLFPLKTGEGSNRIRSFNENHVCQMVDMTNISINNDYPRFMEVLHQTEGVRFQAGEKLQNISNEEYAIYYYPQNLIRTNSNLPFFVINSKFILYQKDNAPLNNSNENQIIKCFESNLNNKNFTFFKIGETYFREKKKKKWNNDGLFKIASGIKTGNNSKYLREKTEVNSELIISDSEALKLSKDEKDKGILTGPHFVSFEMGQKSDSENGLLPSYYQLPSTTLINWSIESVKSMQKEAHSDLANKEFRFKKLTNQISFSTTGQYAPTFRIPSGLIFLNKASRIFLNENDNQFNWLGIFNSKLFRFFISNFSNHTVEFGVEDLKSVIWINNLEVRNLVQEIIKKQKSNPRYDYASHEQIEIDKLVYEAYGLTAEDVEEVENWYARRYPKLSAAQKANLRKLGKSDDYLELYGMK
ncbi:MAG: Eco57I restriction-modification methylase domain-containing protein, partial [bacterium]